MEIYTGKIACGGIAFGKLSVYRKDDFSVKHYHISDVNKEISRFYEAKSTALKQLSSLYDKTFDEIGKESASIFEIHKMMIEDLDYVESVSNIITSEKINAEYAVKSTGDSFSKIFADMEDEYMKSRSADVKDISERIISILNNEVNERHKCFMSDEDIIILADDIMPSEAIHLDGENVKAFVTLNGSTNSHTAIIARIINIPALVCTNIALDDNMNGKAAIVDGYSGRIYINPDEKTISEMKKRSDYDNKQKELLATLIGKENVTSNGRKINLYANIGNVKDLNNVLLNDAGGIGLFRSEFIYLESERLPTEEEQFIIYKTLAETMKDKPVIIRTLDIGNDKQIKYLDFEHEENPAMGYRAIRICLNQPDIFRTQLRAILRASAYGNIAIMYPMIISVGEVIRIKSIVNEVKSELRMQNIAFGNVQQGIMVETPAAVMISDLLAEEVDFFSIGTNDLSQYSLAIDRQNPMLNDFFDPHHEAILRMIKLVIDNAHRNNIWVGICGELAADTELTEIFIDMGIDELSVSPSNILNIRKKIRDI